jgi:hypothetical protein
VASNAEKTKTWVHRVSQAFKGLGDTRTRFKLCLEWLAKIYVPLTPLTDGGRARGRFVGMLGQLGITLDNKIIHDKSVVEGKFDSQEYSLGMREGRALHPQRARVQLELLYAANRQMMKLQKIKDKAALTQLFVDKLSAEFAKGGP